MRQFGTEDAPSQPKACFSWRLANRSLENSRHRYDLSKSAGTTCSAAGLKYNLSFTRMPRILDPPEREQSVAKALFPGRRVHWMPLDVDWSPPTRSIRHCCASMVDALRFECEEHSDPFACADALIVYNEIMNEYGLIIHDGTASYLLIDCCPWCGTRLPASARDQWFDEVDALDLGDGVPPPAQFLSGAWRRP